MRKQALFVAMRRFARSTTCGLRECGEPARTLVAAAAHRWSDTGNPPRWSWTFREPCPDPHPPSPPRNDGVSPENRRPDCAIRMDFGGASMLLRLRDANPGRYADVGIGTVTKARGAGRIQFSSALAPRSRCCSGAPLYGADTLGSVLPDVQFSQPLFRRAVRPRPSRASLRLPRPLLVPRRSRLVHRPRTPPFRRVRGGTPATRPPQSLSTR